MTNTKLWFVALVSGLAMVIVPMACGGKDGEEGEAESEAESEAEAEAESEAESEAEGEGQSCAETLLCADECGDAGVGCVVGCGDATCESGSQLWDDFFACASGSCLAECSGDDDAACDTCVGDNCSAEAAACQAHTSCE